MAEVRLPSLLLPLTRGVRTLSIPGETVGEVILELERRYPGMREKLLDGKGIKQFTNIFVNGEDIRFLQELGTPLQERDVMAILPAISGGTRYSNLMEAIGHTPMVEMARLSPKGSVRIFAKLEGNNPTGSVKDRIAKYMIEQAEKQGLLTPGKTILEPTSGNTGISLALIAKRKGYRLIAVMPENVSPERVDLLRFYGAEIVFSPGEEGTNGAIRLAQELIQGSDYFMPYQYGNPANPQAHYETTGAEIIQDLPEVDVFVAGLGTGGTLMGVGRRLREHNPRIKVMAVVPHPGDQIMGLRSLEEGFIPPILDLSLLDGRFVVESRDAFLATKVLLEKEGIFAGISSGAVLYTAVRIAHRLEKGNIVALLADGGWKYISSRLWIRPYEDMETEAQSQIWW